MSGASERRLILVHGWGVDSRVWDGQRDGLSTLGRVEMVDLPGHGLGASRWSEPTLVSVALKILEAASGSPAPVVGIGWSLGAMALIKAALKEPERFEALVLVGASARFVRTKGYPHGQPRPVVRRMLSNLKADPTGTLERFYRLNFTADELRLDAAAGFIKQYKTAAARFNLEDLLVSLEALIAVDLRARLTDLKMPTLLIHGRLDEVTPVGAAEYMHDNIARSELHIFDHAGHAPFITEPERFDAIVREFLLRIKNGTG